MTARRGAPVTAYCVHVLMHFQLTQ